VGGSETSRLLHAWLSKEPVVGKWSRAWTTLQALVEMTTVCLNRLQVTLRGLLDLSAAFDCVDHQLLLQRLRRDFGFTETVLAWTTSFVTGRTQQVLYTRAAFQMSNLSSMGSHRDLSLAPYCLSCIRQKSAESLLSTWLKFHQYADDCQIYVATTVSEVHMCHRPAFALSSRRRRLDDCKPTTPERSAPGITSTDSLFTFSFVVYCRRRRLSTLPTLFCLISIVFTCVNKRACACACACACTSALSLTAGCQLVNSQHT